MTASKVFISAADYGRFGKSFLVDTADFTFEEIPSISLVRDSPACGAFQTPEGDVSVIVMGGDHYYPPLLSQEVARVQSTTEIYNLSIRKWASGPDLPRGFNLGGCANDLDRNSVILAGGFGNHYDDNADLIQFVPETLSFQIMAGVLATPKHLFGMTSFVDDQKC